LRDRLSATGVENDLVQQQFYAERNVRSSLMSETDDCAADKQGRC